VTLITKAQLKKAANEMFIPEMKNRGYTYSAKYFNFYKENNGIFYFLMPSVTRGGNVSFYYFAWAKELYLGEYDMSNFPGVKGILTGDELAIDWDDGDIFWEMSTPIEQQKSFEKILGLVDGKLEEWFQSVDSGQRFIEELEYAWHEDSKFEQRCKYILEANLGSDSYKS
jgi:hypothetical protein